jgi:chromosome segregation protein
VVKLVQQLEWQNNQINTLVNQAKSAEMDMDGIGKEIAANENAINELNQTIRQDNEQLRGIPIDEIQQQLVHWNTTQAVTERALREVVGRVIESKQTIAQNQAVIEQVNSRIEEVVTATAEVRAAIEESKKTEELVNISLDEFSQKINPAESELRKLESEYSELQHEYSQTQQFEANADRVYTQAQLEYSRSREALEGLRRRIEDDFGLVTLEYSDEVTGPTPLPLEGVGTLVVLDELPKGLEESINRQRALLRRMGAINPEARKEYQEVKERHDFMKTQLADLQKADSDLRQIITELDELMNRQFRTTFNEVATEFKEMFSRLFGGGSARLVMTDTENPTETGIDIEARLPGRREQGLSLLSGGERSLTAVALIFSLLRVSPTPFCILDEVDAMLDEANVGRFTELLKELSQETQFIVITHNRNTVQVADVIYGVTMGRDSASQVISLRLDELSDEMVK